MSNPFYRSLGMLLAIVFLAVSARAAQNPDNVAKKVKHANDVASGPIPYHNISEVLAVMKANTDPAAVQDAYIYLPRIPINDHEDLMALYQFTKNAEEGVPRFLNSNDYNAWQHGPNIAAAHLAAAVAPALQGDVVTLLQYDLASLRRRPSSAQSARGALKDSLFSDRFASLIIAAGNGKNEKARPVLWEIVDYLKDRPNGQTAVDSLGKIGHPEDLERLIGMIKKSPALRFSFGSFGETVGPRLLREFDDPALSSDLQARFALGVRDSVSHRNISTYMPLLKSGNEFLAREDARGIATRLKPEDVGVLREMIANPNAEVRIAAIEAIGYNAWSDAGMAILLDVLKHDSSPINRDAATYFLGKHKVQGAVANLTDALNDPDSNVRAGARSALKKISTRGPARP